MKCIQHPEQPVAAYCQNCGKALCPACVRSVAGNVYCESCLAARLGLGSVGAPAAQGQAAGTTATPGAGLGAEPGMGTGVPPGTVPGAMPPVIGGPRPNFAAILGFCPGVGAMYNGQYVKAFVHVLIFCVLVGLTNTYSYFGMLIAAWVFYQVFDAYQTAEARRLGLPLPDPFGLNDLGVRLGVRNSAVPPVPPSGASASSASTGAASSASGPVYGGYGTRPNVGPSVAGQQDVPGASAYAQGSAYAPGAESTPYVNVGPYPPMGEPIMPPPARVRRPEPIGALILIGLGLLFLFNALGYFPAMWLGRGWPLLLIGLGVWLLVRRSWESNSLKGGGQ